MKKIICFFSTTRADYNLQYNIIDKLKKSKKYTYKLIISGTHFSKKYGNTEKEIYFDKIKVNNKIFTNFDNYSLKNFFKNNSKIFFEFSMNLSKISPDKIVLLGDRLETLLAAISAYTLNIPIIHIGGGEITQGSVDDSYRHCITKLSSFHLVSNNIYKKRIIQLGENKKNIFVIGNPADEMIYKEKLIGRKKLENKYKFKFYKKNILFTFHPETNNLAQSEKQIDIILEYFKKIKDTLIIITYPNIDLNSNYILNAIKLFKTNNENCIIFSNLGRKNYLSFLNNVDAVVGNSSSGITEAPLLNKPTINIGNRQKGRERNISIIDCKLTKLDLKKSFNKIYNKNFLKKIKKNKLNYSKNYSNNFIKIISKIDNVIYDKKFIDLK